MVGCNANTQIAVAASCSTFDAGGVTSCRNIKTFQNHLKEMYVFISDIFMICYKCLRSESYFEWQCFTLTFGWIGLAISLLVQSKLDIISSKWSHFKSHLQQVKYYLFIASQQSSPLKGLKYLISRTAGRLTVWRTLANMFSFCSAHTEHITTRLLFCFQAFCYAALPGIAFWRKAQFFTAGLQVLLMTSWMSILWQQPGVSGVLSLQYVLLKVPPI